MEAAALLILGLATWQAVEIWHHSKLFAGRRADVSLWAGWWYHGPFAIRQLARCRLARPRLGLLRLYHNCRGWLGDLLVCPWCTSVWTAGLLYLLWTYLPEWVRVGHYALAVSRVANALNDLTHPRCRTPRQAKTGFEVLHDGSHAGSPGPAVPSRGTAEHAAPAL